ncbi:MAG: VCBS repeat-containing protein, partial [Planctomycetota bacterium]|nr:VCBS repeat-containing protein [Planctomycetota bacterium]
RLPISPLLKIDETVFINRVHAVDINGDGKTDILAAVTKGGKGGLIVLEKKGQEWTQTYEKIDSVAHAYELIVGDFNGDQVQEAFLIFKWQAGYHWYIGFEKDIYCSRVRLNPNAPYVGGGCSYDINDDGRDELLLGRPATVNGKIEIYQVTANQSLQSVPDMTILASTLLGGARSFAKDETGLIAATVSVPKSFGKDKGMVEYNGLALLRWDNGQLKLLKHLPFGYRHEGTMSSMGPVHKGQFLGDRAFVWRSKRFLNKSPRKLTGVIPEAIPQGVKLQFLIGDENKEPILIGYPGGIFATTLSDLDGDENSELLVLVDAGLGEATLKVHGAPTNSPPPVRARKIALSSGTEEESLLKTVEDLLQFGSPDSFQEAYELAGQLGQRYRNSAVGQRA